MAFRPPFTSGAVSEVEVVAAFPESPEAGDLVQLGTTRITFIWNGVEWEAMDVVGFWAERGEVIGVGAPVVLDALGDALACQADTHFLAHGVAGHINNGDVFIVTGGVVSGYSGLTIGEGVIVHRDGGVVSLPVSPAGMVCMIPLGHALAEDKMMVRLGTPIGMET